MNELDKRTCETLPPNDTAQLGRLDEPSLWEQVKQLFQGRLWWVSLLVAVGGGAFWIFMIVSVVYFFQAESVRAMLAWAGGFGLSLIAVSLSRLWFWLMFHRNAVVREVKRVELLVARLAGRPKMPA
jgi:hypothetical protein